MAEETPKKKVSRRNFLKNTGWAVGGLALGGVLGTVVIPGRNTEDVKQEAVEPENVQAMQFFTRKEDFDCLSAATECIYPADDHGPGAIALGVPYFIDKQLATAWGNNADEYRQFPFQEGETVLSRGEIFIRGLRKLNEVSQANYDQTFRDLDEADQIAILQQFEAGEVEMDLISSAEFFGLLRQSTLEGCYSDPTYGGNKNMEGWRMREFPGAQMSYINEVENEFKVIEPMSLGDMMH
jgi:gluconate 2-dehydrogenase gamma chain